MASAAINSVELGEVLNKMNGNSDSSACRMKGQCVLSPMDPVEGHNLEMGLNLEMEMDALMTEKPVEDGMESMEEAGETPDFWSCLVAEEPHQNPENLWMYALDQFDKRLTKIETVLAMNDGEKKTERLSKNISKDQMIEAVVASIKELSNSNFGIGKSLMKKFVSERLGIDLVNSHYYQKRLNAIIKYALSQRLFSYDRETHLFKMI